jgi:hypothetical protein
MDEIFEAEQKRLTQEPLNPVKLTLTFQKSKSAEKKYRGHF